MHVFYKKIIKKTKYLSGNCDSRLCDGTSVKTIVLRTAKKLQPCGSLNVTGIHNFTGSGTIRKCGSVGMGRSLLEEVCPYRGGP